MRADAVRNRVRLLEAAELVFGQKGALATTEEVALAAGVGIGTVFRHFPTKEALVEELLRMRAAELAVEADAVQFDSDRDVLFSFFEDVLKRAARKKMLTEVLAAAGAGGSKAIAQLGASLRLAMARLVKRGIAEGTIRPGIEVGEVLGLLMGLAQAVEHGGWSEATRRRALSIIINGMRVR